MKKFLFGMMLAGLIMVSPSGYGQEELAALRIAAEDGDIAAQATLGSCYYNGDGVAKDHTEAEQWLRLAAKQGDAGSQALLGILYYEGTTILQDYEEAGKWIRLAAKQGNLDAQRYMGLCYFNGAGVSKDYIEAYAWFNIASAQGDKKAVSLRENCLRKMKPKNVLEAQRLSRKYAERFLKQTD